jgi:hypothetical protein
MERRVSTPISGQSVPGVHTSTRRAREAVQWSLSRHCPAGRELWGWRAHAHACDRSSDLKVLDRMQCKPFTNLNVQICGTTHMCARECSKAARNSPAQCCKRMHALHGAGQGNKTTSPACLPARIAASMASSHIMPDGRTRDTDDGK